MAKGVIASVWFVVWLGCFSHAAEQLQLNEVKADLYWLQATRLMRAGNAKKALDKLKEICKLEGVRQKRPDGFHMKFANVALAEGEVETAIHVIKSYFSGLKKKDQYYNQMLDLLDKAKQAKDRRHEWKKSSCHKKKKGDLCWKPVEVDKDSCCYAYISKSPPGHKVIWTGRCFGGLAHGRGTLKWMCDGCGNSCESTGSFTLGKQHGRWIERGPNGRIIKEGKFEDGKREGEWVFRFRATYKSGECVKKPVPSEMKACATGPGNSGTTCCR